MLSNIKKQSKASIFQRPLPTTESNEFTIVNLSTLKTGNESVSELTLSQNYLNVYNDNIIYGKLNLGLDASLNFSDGSEQTIAYTAQRNALLYEHDGKIAQLFENDRIQSNYNNDNNTYKQNKSGYER